MSGAVFEDSKLVMLRKGCDLVTDKTRQDKTRQDKTRQDKTRQDKTRQDKTRRNMAWHSNWFGVSSHINYIK